MGSRYFKIEAKKFNPRLVIKNISNGLDTDQQISENIIWLNNLEGYDSSSIKIFTKLKHFTKVNVVIKVSPTLRKLLIGKGFLFVGWKKSAVLDPLHVLRCYKCCSFGHIEKECQN